MKFCSSGCLVERIEIGFPFLNCLKKQTMFFFLCHNIIVVFDVKLHPKFETMLMHILGDQ